MKIACPHGCPQAVERRRGKVTALEEDDDAGRGFEDANSLAGAAARVVHRLDRVVSPPGRRVAHEVLDCAIARGLLAAVRGLV
jgi:hypothetical protein